jgi:hypothetical protein
MEITYEWSIISLDCATSKSGLTNVVENISWRYSGIDENDVMYHLYGDQHVDEPNPSEFIDYENLTQSIIIGWLESQINVSDLQRKIQDNIQLIERPSKVTLPPPGV